MSQEQIVKDGDKIVVWFSCGAASAVAAKKTIELYADRCKIHKPKLSQKGANT